MPRHKRRPKMFVTERDRFVAEAADHHRRLRRYLAALKPGSEDYRAVLAVSDALCAAVRTVSGTEPPWVTGKSTAKIGPGPLAGSGDFEA